MLSLLNLFRFRSAQAIVAVADLSIAEGVPLKAPAPPEITPFPSSLVYSLLCMRSLPTEISHRICWDELSRIGWSRGKWRQGNRSQ